MMPLLSCKSARLVFMAFVASLALSLAAPASADPKQSEVVGACSRTKGCYFAKQPGAPGVIGCSPHACFSCNGVTCHEIPRSDVKRRPVTGTARGGSSAGSASGPANARSRVNVTAGTGSFGNTHHSGGGRH
jgi:hypothetical protein